MQISFDTNNLSAQDIALLNVLVGGGQSTVLSTDVAEVGANEPDTVVAPLAPKKAAAPKPAPKVEPEVPSSEEAGDTGEEDLLGGAPTMADAVAAATKVVSDGKAKLVKDALAVSGTKKVSELKDEDIPAFLAAIA